MITHYEVVTDFPTATKDWVVGEIVKKGTALFKKAHKFPKFFQPVEEVVRVKKGDYIVITDTAGNRANYSGKKTGELLQVNYVSSNTDSRYFVCETSSDVGNGVFVENFRKATPAEIKKYNEIKVGDVVIINTVPTLWQSKTGGKYPLMEKYPFVGKVEKIEKDSSGDIGANIKGFGFCITDNKKTITKWRIATKEEIVEYNKTKFKQITNLGTNNITLEWDGKDKLRIIQKGSDSLTLSALTKWYDSVTKLDRIAIGSYNVFFFDRDAKTILIGCQEEKNLVSLNEIGKVINFCK